MVLCTVGAPGAGNGCLCTCYPIPPELPPSPSGAPVLWLEVLVDCLLHALVFYHVKIGGWDRGECAYMYEREVKI